MSKLKGRKWEQENKRRRCLRRSLVIVWEECLQQQQQTWTGDRRCITAARRGRWGPAEVGQGDEEGLASVSRRSVLSCREGEGKRCCLPDHSVSPMPVLVSALDTADAASGRASLCVPRPRRAGADSQAPWCFHQLRYATTARTEGQGSGIGNFPRGLECSWPFCPGGRGWGVGGACLRSAGGSSHVKCF